MSIEQSIDKLAGAILALAHAMGNNQVAAPVTEKEIPVPEKGQEKPAPKAEAEKPKAKPALAEPADTPSTVEADGAQSSKGLDYEADIKPLFLKLVQTKGRDEGRAFIDALKPGAPKLSDAFKPGQEAEVLAKLQEALS